MANNVHRNESHQNLEYKSKFGYTFISNSSVWILNKNCHVYVGSTLKYLCPSLADSYVKTLAFFAQNYSAGYTRAINNACRYFLKTTNCKIVTDVILINFRSTLTMNEEWRLGHLKSFFKKWYELGYLGISDEIIILLESWTLKGNPKGDFVRRLDPVKGPLTDLELLAFNQGAVSAFETNKISLTELAMGLVISNTGRRPIQISYLRLKDILKGKNKRGEDLYLLNIPRAKQRQSSFRKQFRQFAVTEDLWAILAAQAEHAIRSIENAVGFDIQILDRAELPLFPDMLEFKKNSNPVALRSSLDTDLLHIKRDEISKTCKLIVASSKIRSERTGEPLYINGKRFRYTIGTRAAREGFGIMVIAELLDHSNSASASSYIENIPEHVESIDKAVGQQMARYAQAFSGVLVDNESSAKRGEDLRSRVKTDGKSIGTCGSYGFCGASVPIPCYTCIHFQPWLDGPHEAVYEKLIYERQRVLRITNDSQLAAINDRSILAVLNVIEKCSSRKKELRSG